MPGPALHGPHRGLQPPAGLPQGELRHAAPDPGAGDKKKSPVPVFGQGSRKQRDDDLLLLLVS